MWPLFCIDRVSIADVAVIVMEFFCALKPAAVVLAERESPTGRREPRILQGRVYPSERGTGGRAGWGMGNFCIS